MTVCHKFYMCIFFQNCVCVKGLENIPSTVMWSAKVVSESGKKMMVYIQAHADPDIFLDKLTT